MSARGGSDRRIGQLESARFSTSAASAEMMKETFGEHIDMLMEYIDGQENELSELDRAKMFPQDGNEFIEKMQAAVKLRAINREKRLQALASSRSLGRQSTSRPSDSSIHEIGPAGTITESEIMRISSRVSQPATARTTTQTTSDPATALEATQGDLSNLSPAEEAASSPRTKLAPALKRPRLPLMKRAKSPAIPSEGDLSARSNRDEQAPLAMDTLPRLRALSGEETPVSTERRRERLPGRLALDELLGVDKLHAWKNAQDRALGWEKNETARSTNQTTLTLGDWDLQEDENDTEDFGTWQRGGA